VKILSQLPKKISERWWELRLGIDTRGIVEAERTKLPDDGVEYAPTPYETFFHAMKSVPADLLAGTFVDYGAGKGRVLVLATRYYNFRRIVGVEISAELCRLAELNLKTAAASRAQIICCDAALYHPPEDAKVFFLFNPFFGQTMKMVVQNIRTSILHNPRRVAVVVCGARNFNAAIAGQDWLIEKDSGKVTFSSPRWHVFLTRAEFEHAPSDLHSKTA